MNFPETMIDLKVVKHLVPFSFAYSLSQPALEKHIHNYDFFAADLNKPVCQSLFHQVTKMNFPETMIDLKVVKHLFPSLVLQYLK